MKRFSTYFFLILFFGCKSNKVQDKNQILDALADRYINESNSKKISEYGLTFVKINDFNYLTNYLKKNEISYVPRKFSLKVSDSLLDILFDKRQVDYFERQLNDDKFNVNDFYHNSPKYKRYNDLIGNFRIHHYYKLHVSKPFFSLDCDYGFLYTLSDGHYGHLIVFKKSNRRWEYFFSYSM